MLRNILIVIVVFLVGVLAGFILGERKIESKSATQQVLFEDRALQSASKASDGKYCWSSCNCRPPDVSGGTVHCDLCQIPCK
jgi:hypothetical protein